MMANPGLGVCLSGLEPESSPVAWSVRQGWYGERKLFRFYSLF